MFYINCYFICFNLDSIALPYYNFSIFSYLFLYLTGLTQPGKKQCISRKKSLFLLFNS